MTPRKVNLIKVEGYIKSFALQLITPDYYSMIAEAVFQRLRENMKHIDTQVFWLLYIFSLLIFGTPQDVWSYIKYEVIKIPHPADKSQSHAPYKRGSNQPVLHCPVCGHPGIPNGTTKSHTHQYFCPRCKKSFTENTCLESELVRYLVLIHAVELFRHSVTKSGIYTLLGMPRRTLKRFLRGVYKEKGRKE